MFAVCNKTFRDSFRDDAEALVVVFSFEACIGSFLVLLVGASLRVSLSDLVISSQID